MTRPYFGPLKQDGKPTPLDNQSVAYNFFGDDQLYNFLEDIATSGCTIPKTCSGCDECVAYVWSVGCTSDNTVDQVYSRDTNNFGEQRNINKWLTQAEQDTSLTSLGVAQSAYAPPSGETTIAPDEYHCEEAGLHLVFVEERLSFGIAIGSNVCNDLADKNPNHSIVYEN